MTNEPRRFRVILDTCDLVRNEPKPEVWPESEVLKHSIFDQRHLSVYKPFTPEGRIKKPVPPKPKAAPKPPKPSKSTKVYSWRRMQEHKADGDLCTLCGQPANEHRPNKKATEKRKEWWK